MGAGKGFLPGVGQLMSLQVSLGYEAEVTTLTSERPLTSVGPNVSLQVACLSELLQTVLKGAKQELVLILRLLNFLNLCTK